MLFLMMIIFGGFIYFVVLPLILPQKIISVILSAVAIGAVIYTANYLMKPVNE